MPAVEIKKGFSILWIIALALFVFILALLWWLRENRLEILIRMAENAIKHNKLEKAKRLLGYEPEMNFKEGLKRVYAWFIENRANIQSCNLNLVPVKPEFETRTENVCAASSVVLYGTEMLRP
jgi:hypothetical protein